MRISVESRGGMVAGTFMDAFADGARGAGFDVERTAAGSASPDALALVVWNGRHLRDGASAIYCEHGWLPRWSFQVSPRGINADSHLAPFRWDGRAPHRDVARQLADHLDEMRRVCPFNAEYMQPDATPVTNVPDEFLLVPLQIETDTNIVRHVPRRLRSMQVFVDLIARSNPPLPLVIKQHPADQAGLHLDLRTSRPQDVLRAHREGNIHQLLKSGQCRGIISLNSNVVHDGILWNVPSVVLGNNIWPAADPGPFLRHLPGDWCSLLHLWDRQDRRHARDAYAWYLISNQWTLDDARDPARVGALLRHAGSGMRTRKTVTVPRNMRKVAPPNDDGYSDI